MSSLDLRHRSSTTLPLTVVAEEVLQWVELASGVDAWRKAANRDSLDRDVAQSVDGLGAHLSGYISSELAIFQASLVALSASGNAVLSQPPGAMRTAPEWGAVSTAAHDLLAALESDNAVAASWDDLVSTAKDRTLEHREYMPMASLMTEQLRRRGIDAESTFRGLVLIVAFGRDPEAMPSGEASTPYADRLDKARK